MPRLGQAAGSKGVAVVDRTLDICGEMKHYLFVERGLQYCLCSSVQARLDTGINRRQSSGAIPLIHISGVVTKENIVALYCVPVTEWAWKRCRIMVSLHRRHWLESQ